MFKLNKISMQDVLVLRKYPSDQDRVDAIVNGIAKRFDINPSHVLTDPQASIAAFNLVSSYEFVYGINKHILIESDEQHFVDKIMSSKINLDQYPDTENTGFTIHFKKHPKIQDLEICGIYLYVSPTDGKISYILNIIKDDKTNTGEFVNICNTGLTFAEIIDTCVNGEIMGGVDELSNLVYNFIVKSVITLNALNSSENASCFTVISGMWRNKIANLVTRNKKHNIVKFTMSNELKSTPWHFRQLVHERYYRGEHADKPRGSRWIFVAPDLNKDDKAKHIPETGFKNKDEAKRVIESVQAA